jgi:transposase
MTSAEIITSYENKMKAMEAEFSARLLSAEEKFSLIQSELNTYQKRCEQYSQAYDQLKNQLSELLRYRFGKKSERFIDPEVFQYSLFDNATTFAAADAAGNQIKDDAIQIPAHARKKKSKESKNLPVRVEIIPVSEEDKQCGCGSCKTVIRYEIKKRLHHQPAVFEIIEQRREVVACPKGCDKAVFTAPAPLQILPKVKASEEFLSFLVVSKLDDRQPLYHLEKQLAQRHNIDCSRQSMARWLIDLMEPLQPIYNLLKDEIIEYDVGSCDATTLQVLKEPGRAAETKSYVYCMRGGPPEKSVILYDYNASDHQAFVKEWFEGFTGYLHVDGDNFFNDIGEIAKLVNCHAHARRKFEPIAQSTKGKGIAKEVLHFYKSLYKIERDAKNKEFTPAQRYELRTQQSKPLLDKFKNQLDEWYPTVLPQSPLGKAINYSIKLWPGLMRFLEDGRLEIDNNLTEQEIKPLVIARKNFMFCASIDGAKALCMHFGFIRTAKAHGLDPYHYYTKLLKNIPHCKVVEDYEKLLPWNIESDYLRTI